MKNFILFLGSLIFYAWGEPVYIILMLFSTFSDFVHGILIEKYRGKKASKVFLVSSIIINLGLLGYFKYADFLIQSVNHFAGTSLPLKKLPLPIGISFYTFQTMSYSIDVYRGNAKAQKNLLDFGVFVTMFPQLIAGPIVTYHQVEKEMENRTFSWQETSYGVQRFVAGLAKKVLLANNLGALWQEISAQDLTRLPVLTAWIGIFAYAFQIYFDFSGYSDMAIGLGACMGFHFPENFRYPYISASVTEFWRRWHISLSSWFRDYVYIPLGGNRKGKIRQLVNILIVWLLTGIWHGAGWNFLFWGLWFACFLILEKLFLGEWLKTLPKAAGWFYTGMVVLIGWVFFSLEQTDQIVWYLKAMFGMTNGGFYQTYSLYLAKEYLLWFLAAIFACTPIFGGMVKRLRQARTGYMIACYRFLEKVIPPVLLLLSIAYIVEASYNPFLYFRF